MLMELHGSADEGSFTNLIRKYHITQYRLCRFGTVDRFTVITGGADSPEILGIWSLCSVLQGIYWEDIETGHLVGMKF